LIAAVLSPSSVAIAQLSGGIGPVGQLSSAATSTWRTSAALSGTARFDNSFTSAELSGQLSPAGGSLRVGSVAGYQQFFSPSIKGLRAVTSLEFTGRQLVDPLAPERVRAASSLSYRNGASGAWAGVVAERGTTSALRTGGWRQLGSAFTFAIASSLRRGIYGKTGSRTWTGTYRDSLPSDSGWVYVQREGIFGDSGSAGRKLSWLETEATLGWSRGRVAFDVVGGWRPPIDSAPRATWFRAMTTVAISKSVAVTGGIGTTMRQIPFAQTTGRYASVAVRLAPAALVRPREIPEITPSAAAFHVERSGEQYLVRVRLPHARIVELSGDFNGWQAVRLNREIDGSWTASLALKPGAYRMNLRVDGERWLPPPGTPAVDDEFNGKVGLVVVR
jgi:hypothetical protein